MSSILGPEEGAPAFDPLREALLFLEDLSPLGQRGTGR